MVQPALNPLISGLSLPPVPAVQGWARDYRGEHGAPIDLSQAVPGYPPHPEMLRLLGEAARSMASAGYGPIEGDMALRHAYANDVSRAYGAPISAANVHITAGCNQAFVCAAMAIASAGDAVALTNPRYFNHEGTLAMLGIATRHIACGADRSFLPDPADVAKAFAAGARGVALVSPNNPTGAIYPPALLREIFELCRRNGRWLILDETYRDFIRGGDAPHALFAEPRWQETLIQLYSFSKSFCIPGHRLGAIVAGETAISGITKIMDNLQICAPRGGQVAVARALPLLDDWRASNRKEIENREAALREAMNALPDWRIEAIGAYFAYVRHPALHASSAMVAEALARQVGVVSLPGEYFGEGQGEFLRFAFANADCAKIAELPSRIAKLTL
jgi:aspartate/methionine/tyrosine aminotransferase